MATDPNRQLVVPCHGISGRMRGRQRRGQDYVDVAASEHECYPQSALSVA
ncbi:MAG: hypothetical protein JO281_05755 [Pseudonocardiales bacterium]|nr:hypothetical protein [Pseudonocardiales bacterium]